MAVKIRLTRMGAKKAPFYRIVAVDSRKARDGQYIEQIGYYNPLKNPAEVKIDLAIAKKWLATGAQPTETVRTLLRNAGAFEPVAIVAETAPVEEAPVAEAEVAAPETAEVSE